MPGFPDRFASLDDARSFLRRFFAWYNDEHRHTGLNLHTPADVHHGRAGAVTAARQLVLDVAHAAHPERFVRKAPVAALPPAAAWINPPLDIAVPPSQEARA
jgi:putative transposase